MNPLNSIINMSESLYKKCKEQLDIIQNAKSDNLSNLSDDDDIIMVSKLDVIEDLDLIQTVHTSSLLIRLLNQAILNLAMIKQNKFQPKFLLVTNPLLIV